MELLISSKHMALASNPKAFGKARLLGQARHSQEHKTFDAIPNTYRPETAHSKEDCNFHNGKKL